MAKYDYGGGCPCGLYAECEPNCEHDPKNRLKEANKIILKKDKKEKSRKSINKDAEVAPLGKTLSTKRNKNELSKNTRPHHSASIE